MRKANDGKYYEGILQLRNCTEEVLDFVSRAIAREKDVFIAKEVKTKDGHDLYLSSNKFLKKIGKMLKEKFPGVMKSSSKLYTRDRQSGKRVYRGTILFRMPNFRVGDIGVMKGDEVRIMSINHNVAVKETKTGRKMQYKFDEIDRNFRALK